MRVCLGLFSEGVLPEVKTFCKIARHVGVETIIPFINISGNDSDGDLEADLVKMDLAEVLPEEEVKMAVKGCLLADSDEKPIQSLLKTLDNTSIRKRNYSSPLFWPLEQVGNIPKRGIFMAGRIASKASKRIHYREFNQNLIIGGSVTSGKSDVMAFYQGNSVKVNLRDLEIFRRVTPELEAGDRGGAFVKLKVDLEMKRGAILYEKDPDLLQGTKWKVEVEVNQDGTWPDIRGQKPVFMGTHLDGKAAFEFSEGTGVMMLTHPVLAKLQDPILIRTENSDFACAHLIEVIQ